MKKRESQGEKLESADLAALIVDALIREGLLPESRAQEAVDIATEEIRVRKIMGDY